MANAGVDIDENITASLEKDNIPYINVDGETINIIPVSLLTNRIKLEDEFYFVHVSYIDDKTIYSTAYVIPPDSDRCANINYIDVPEDCRGKGIASKLLSAIEKWCLDRRITLIRLDNDTDINPETGLPSTLYERAGYHYIHRMIYDETTGKNKLNGPEMEKVLIGGKHSSECFLNEEKFADQEKKIEGSNKKKNKKID